MNKRTAENYYYLQKECDILEYQYSELIESVQAKSKRLTGMPFAKTNATNDSVLEFAIKEEDIRQRIREKVSEINKLLLDIEEFVESIDNSEVRSIIRLRCILLFDWKSISDVMGKSEDAVKSSYRKFWKEQE